MKWRNFSCDICLHVLRSSLVCIKFVVLPVAIFICQYVVCFISAAPFVSYSWQLAVFDLLGQWVIIPDCVLLYELLNFNIVLTNIKWPTIYKYYPLLFWEYSVIVWYYNLSGTPILGCSSCSLTVYAGLQIECING